MPVSTEVNNTNKSQTDRMRSLISRLRTEDYAVRLKNGWTVAGALGHIAFWDRQRLCLLKRCVAGTEWTGVYDGDVFNETLQPFLEAIPPEKIATLALENAEAIDDMISALPNDIMDAALQREDAPNVERGYHREYHLDQIDEALANAK